MIGPAPVGIDYALFHRHPPQTASWRTGWSCASDARATATAGGAVVFAASKRDSLYARSPSRASHSSPPSVHRRGRGGRRGLRGDDAAAGHVGGPRSPHQNSLRVKLGKDPPDDKEPHGWRRWAEWVSQRPWSASVAALLILVVLALPVLQLDLGQNDISALPKETTSRQAYDSLNKGFGPGVNGPLLIASEFSSPQEAKQVLPQLEKAVGAARRAAVRNRP